MHPRFSVSVKALFFLAILLTEGMAEPSPTLPQSAEALFYQGNQALGAGDYKAASEAYEAALASKPNSSLYFNAAQALMCQGYNGKALLYLEKACAIDPSPRTLQALRELRSSLKIQSGTGMLSEWAHSRTLAFWYNLAAQSCWAAAILWLIAIRHAPQRPLLLRLTLIPVALFVLSLSGITGYGWVYSRVILLESRPASTTGLRVAPTTDSPVSHQLPAGTAARIIGKREDFRLVETLGNERVSGWIKTSEMGFIYE